MIRVAVVGDVVLDVVVRVRAPFAATSDTPAETVVGRGGSGANLAVALAHAGCEVTFVGAAGRDDAAQLVEDDLARHGVRARLVRAGAATGTVVALVDEQGQRAMLTDRGANGALSPDAAEAVLPVDATHLHVSGYTVLDGRTREGAAALLARARDAGWSTSVDVCSVAPLRALGREAFIAATRAASMLFANAEEAAALSGCAEPDGALEVLVDDYGEVLVTRGADGAVAARGSERARVDARATTVIDTTGAGDAASGAYLAARLAGDTLAGALEAAMAAAARIVGGLGAVPYSRE